MTKHLSTILAFLTLCSPLWASDVYVGTTADLTNALATATSNDTVWCSNGTYTCASAITLEDESLTFLSVGPGVTVRSLSGNPSDVIIDGNALGRVLTMDASSWLIGCTVSNGLDTGYSGGAGGGVKGGSVLRCFITCNTSAYNFGGGVHNCVVYSSLLTKNYAPSGIAGAGGGAAYSTLYNCTVAYNTNSVEYTGGGMYDCTAIGSISWSNSSADTVTESYSCGLGYTGTGSITNDPLFVSATDFRLQSNSLCINTGTNGVWTAGARDLDGYQRIWPQGGKVDMGAYEYGSQSAYPIPHIRGASLSNLIGSVSGGVITFRGTME